MKTTIELPDDLFTEAKAEAARRRTTMKAMIEHALRREIQFPKEPGPDAPYEINEFGFPTLKKTGDAPVTSDMIYQMMEELGI